MNTSPRNRPAPARPRHNPESPEELGTRKPDLRAEAEAAATDPDDPAEAARVREAMAARRGTSRGDLTTDQLMELTRDLAADEPDLLAFIRSAPKGELAAFAAPIGVIPWRTRVNS